MTRLLIILALLLLAAPARATVIFSSNAEGGTCGNGVLSSYWDYTESGSTPNSRMFYRCDTPVPGTGHSNYFRVDTVNSQDDSWNIYSYGSYTMNVGSTYYLGGFFRFDRIGGNDIWIDNAANGMPDSYDKLFEFNSGLGTVTRYLITAGWTDQFGDCDNNFCNGKFTFSSYLGMTSCSGDCGVNAYEQQPQNYNGYSSANPYFCDYGKWYAVVAMIKPSNGSTKNGELGLWINGTKVYEGLNVKTQDGTNLYFDTFYFYHSGTTAQPGYDAPAHYRKFDQFMFTTTLQDMTDAGLMEDPEAAGTTLAPLAPKLLRVLK